TFADKLALVEAEVARLDGRGDDAEPLYQRAVRLAVDCGFPHFEAIAREVHARFLAGRGEKEAARRGGEAAHLAYLRWGAVGKARDLERRHHLREAAGPLVPQSTIEASVEQFDVMTAVRASRSITSEIVLERLVASLLETALRHAGATRGALMLPAGDGLAVEAEAHTPGASIAGDPCRVPAGGPRPRGLGERAG